MNAPSLLDVLIVQFPTRQLVRVLLLLAGVATLVWGGLSFSQSDYWADLALYGAAALGLFYMGIGLRPRDSEVSLIELLRSSGENLWQARTATQGTPATDSIVAEVPAVAIPPGYAPVPMAAVESFPAEMAAPIAATASVASPATATWPQAPAFELPKVQIRELVRIWPVFALPFAAWVQLSWLRQVSTDQWNPNFISIVLMLVAVAAFYPVMRTLSKPRVRLAAGVSPADVPFRWKTLTVGVLAMAVAYFFSSGNEFTRVGVVAWLAGVLITAMAFWEGAPSVDWRGAWSRWSQEVVTFQLSRVGVLLTAILIVAAFFRFAALKTIPIEMTSDHVEKLLDVNDVLQGMRPIFFERNTGRETLQFYWAALVATVMGTGLTQLTLKISSAVAGLLTVPFIYKLGKELEDETLGLFGAALAAIGFWPTAISRVGLRFPFSPIFIAAALFFLFRGFRTYKRNDFVWAGLILGAGLYGYSTFRVMAVVVALLAAAFLLRRQSNAERVQLVGHLVAMAVVVLAVFIPLLRYANEKPENFWERSSSRLRMENGDLPPHAVSRFISNNWGALRMFNWKGNHRFVNNAGEFETVGGDQVWVNTLPGQPILDYATGGLLILGASYLIYRAVRHRLVRDWLVLALVPALMLPSTLSLAYPNENPSVVRAAGVMVVVFLIAAQPLRLAIRYAKRRLGNASGALFGGLLVGGLLLIAARQNYEMYFVKYPEQYIGSAQNASEVGQVIHDFAHSVGSYDTAVVLHYPFWVDTRAVGMYSGKFGWDNVYVYEERDRLPELKDDPRPKLYILHKDDRETIPLLRELYPNGTLSRYVSSRPYHDFLLYFVPGTLNLDENTLPPVGSP